MQRNRPSPCRRSCRWPLLVLACLVLAPSLAQARWYQVEVIVFRNTGSLSTGSEVWPERDLLPDFRNSVELVTDLPSLADEPGVAAGAAAPIAFQPLPIGERRLVGVERQLARSGDYEPLLAAAWRQPSFGVGSAKRVHLAAPGVGRVARADAEVADSAAMVVEGTVGIKVSRLLYAEVDFLYDHDGTPVRLHETRRLKLREIHYFDHPLFGVIVQVSPWTVPEVEATATVGADEPEDPDGAAPGE